MRGGVSEAIILAAGVGKRLGRADLPKCLLEIGGRTLLARHLSHLAAGGVRRVIVVSGHSGHMIEEHLADIEEDVEVRLVRNPDYRRGSVLSLGIGLDALEGIGDHAVWMDADVLYHPQVLDRLLDHRAPLTFLMDPNPEASGEEMIIGARGGRVLRIDRGPEDGWDASGESVGFFSIATEEVARFSSHIAEFAAAGRGDSEYEEALHEFLPGIEAGYVDVGGLPWTEIDFPEDVTKAEEILARIREAGAGG